ncbi:MAG: Hsp20/alpha crystallin family protein, partial [Atribacterota bacterium]|nr:Hsp20/alpha crystallin family protein [Atribacterota bacterium]
LTIEGEIEKDKDVKKEDYYCCERVYGKFSRSISLPVGIDKDNIKANYKNGILEISLPKKPEEKPKEITIETN